MTYFADLTDYNYLRLGRESPAAAKNVGWLAPGHAFDTAPATEDLLDRLWSYCRVSVAQTRGIHWCEFCPTKKSCFAERNGEKLWLGTAEIRVFSDAGSIYAAPTLIYHYVKEHDYKPPDAFIEALLTQLAPPAVEYFERLSRESLEWRPTANDEAASEPAAPLLKSNYLTVQLPSDRHGPAISARVNSEIRLGDIALLLIGGFIAGAGLGFIGVLLTRSVTDSNFAADIVGGISVNAAWLLGYEWLAKNRGWRSLRERFSTLRPGVLVFAAVSAVAMILLASAVVQLLRSLGVDVKEPPLPDFLPRSGGQLVFAIALIAIVAPLTEELIFRGVLLDWLKQKINVWVAALVLSVIFALLHDNNFKLGAIGVIAFSSRMTLGLLSSAFAIRFSSLRASFVLHATLNGVICVSSVLSGP